MVESKQGSRQRQLPIAEAEGLFAERRNRLAIALRLLEDKCDAELAIFVLWVFNATQGGLSGALTKSYDQLRARPFGGCCSLSKMRATVTKAKHLGLIEISRTPYASGGQKANGYKIDWDGVNRIIPIRPGVSGEQSGVSGEQPGVSGRHPLGITTSCTSSFTSVPVPEGSAGADHLREEIFGSVPELVQAARYEIEPLAPGRLVYGAFSSIELAHLRQPERLVSWYRMQAGLPSPVMVGRTEADALLTVAAGVTADRIPDEEIKKNRLAVFANLITRRKWRSVLPMIPEARNIVDRGIEKFGAHWLGRIEVEACKA